MNSFYSRGRRARRKGRAISNFFFFLGIFQVQVTRAPLRQQLGSSTAREPDTSTPRPPHAVPACQSKSRPRMGCPAHGCPLRCTTSDPCQTVLAGTRSVSQRRDTWGRRESWKPTQNRYAFFVHVHPHARSARSAPVYAEHGHVRVALYDRAASMRGRVFFRQSSADFLPDGSKSASDV
jgi:hypothetical protein